MMKRTLLIIVALLAAVAVSQAPKPTVTVSAPPKSVVAGSKLSLTLTVTFAPGFHGYQNPPATEYEIPVEVKVDGKEFKAIKVNYPPGVDASVGGSEKSTKAYEGTIKIPVLVQVPAKLGMKDLKFIVSYQLCDETSCFPPDQVLKTVKVNVVKKAGKA
jgi:DsbC/DsbD-like thiol-disulfide interchange protein